MLARVSSNVTHTESALSSGLHPHQSARVGSLAQLLESQSTMGVRRLTLLAIQLLTELRLAQRSKLSLASVHSNSVLLVRPETPFEQATILRASGARWHEEQERIGLAGVGALLSVMLDKPLYLEDSIPDERRFGGAPFPRRSDRPLLRGLAKALRLVASRCTDGAQGYVSATAALEDLGKVLTVVNRAIARRTPPAPVTALGRPAAVRCVPFLPKVVVRSEASPPSSAGSPSGATMAA